MKEAILKLLENNSRLTFDDLAKMLKTTEDEVRLLIKNLEEDNIIVSYNTLIDWDKLKKERVSAFIDVKVTPQRGVGFEQIAERIKKYPEVIDLYLMSGSYDFSVVIEGKSLLDVSQFVSEKLACIENVQSTRTHFILKKYKQFGVIFDEKNEEKRQVVTL